MAKLFAQEVPEIYDGIVEVKAVARDPGSRAKIAVISRDSSVDPVGACVGMRGSRVQAVVNELQGEKIDIIPWSQDTATFVVNALAPAEVAKVVLDEDRQRIEVVVPDQQLSLAIGRRGQNVRLASQLTGWDIDILTEQEESERRQAEFEKRTKIFMEALNVDEVVGQLLASEGFTSVEELAFVDAEGTRRDRGLRRGHRAGAADPRAANISTQIEAELDAKRTELGVEDELKEVPGVTTAMLVALGENGVKTVEDLAGCATDDLAGWTERKDGESQARARLPRRLRAVARGMPRRSSCRRASRPAGSPKPISRRRRRRRAAGRSEPRLRNEPGGRIATDAGARRHATTPGRAMRAAAPSDLRRHARGQAGRRADPLRGRARTGRRSPISSASCPAAASGSRRPAQAVDEAVKRKAFARGFKREVRAAADLGRAGRAACWSAPRSMRSASPTRPGGSRPASPRSKRRWRDEPVAAVLQASERRRGRGRASSPRPSQRQMAGIDGEIPSSRRSRSAQLDLALGRSNVVHAALLAGPASDGVPRALPAPRTLPDRCAGRTRPGNARLKFDGTRKADVSTERTGTEWHRPKRKLPATRR